MRRVVLSLAVCSLLAMAGCGANDTTTPSSANVALQFEHNVNGLELFFDSLNYLNGDQFTGQVFDIDRLKYFISEVRLLQSNGTTFLARRPHIIDASVQGDAGQLSLSGIPPGRYDRVVVAVGIPDDLNVAGSLTDPIFDDMVLPDSLGGGYYYMRCEGQFRAANDVDDPLTNYFLNTCRLQTTSYVVQDTLRFAEITIEDGDRWVIDLSMDVVEWLKNPNPYNFPPAGQENSVYTDATQALLQQNGRTTYLVSPPVQQN